VLDHEDCVSAVSSGKLLLAQPDEAQTGVLRQVRTAEAQHCRDQVDETAATDGD
jgi:hypothetical protein